MRFRADINLVPWLSGLEQRAHNPSDFGSNPNGTTKRGSAGSSWVQPKQVVKRLKYDPLAQLVEHRPFKAGVQGSSP